MYDARLTSVAAIPGLVCRAVDAGRQSVERIRRRHRVSGELAITGRAGGGVWAGDGSDGRPAGSLWLCGWGVVPMAAMPGHFVPTECGGSRAPETRCQ